MRSAYHLPRLPTLTAAALARRCAHSLSCYPRRSARASRYPPSWQTSTRRAARADTRSLGSTPRAHASRPRFTPIFQPSPVCRPTTQLKVLLDTLPDYPLDEQQPSYVMAIPCRPVLIALAQLLSGAPQGLQSMQHVNWQLLKDHP